MKNSRLLALGLTGMLALGGAVGCKKAVPDNSGLEACEAARKSTQAELDALKGQMAELEARNNRYQDLLNRRMAIDKELREKLKGLIEGGQLRISYRRGLMLLELPQEVLFDSGKAVVKAEGKTIITQVSQALSSVNDRRLLVAGHTDNDPIKNRKSTYASNWELSTARSQAVVNQMITDGVKAENVGVSGFGEFDPISSNDSAEGKQANRRIEIILIPDLEELMRIEQEIEKEAAELSAASES